MKRVSTDASRGVVTVAETADETVQYQKDSPIKGGH